MNVEQRNGPAWGWDDGSLVEVQGAWLGMLYFHSRRCPFRVVSRPGFIALGFLLLELD